jgi:hypothetical protein
MSKIEEIEHAVEQLPLTDFVKLASWVDQRRQRLEIFPSTSGPDKSQGVARDHSAFLNRYVAQDEGLHDDNRPDAQKLTPREALRRLQLEGKLERSQAEYYLRNARAERLTTDT